MPYVKLNLKVRQGIIPLHLCAPQDVFFVIHKHREVLILALLYGIRTSGNSLDFIKLKNKNLSLL